jgi:hypothetical protein
MPRQGLLLATLIGLKAKQPDACHGMRQFPTANSIALMLWDVTLA